MTAHQLTTSKPCNKCGVEKPLADFALCHRYRDGRIARCKVCNNAVKRDRAAIVYAARDIADYARRVSARYDGYLSEDPSTWLRPGDTLMAGGYDWAWCYRWFKEIPGFTDYAAGDSGTIWARKPGSGVGISGQWKLIKGCKGSDGYLKPMLKRGNKWISCRAHCLILETFVGPCPPGMWARHFIDNDRTNNRLDNLRWGTPKENNEDTRRHGTIARGERSGSAKLTSAMISEMYDMFRNGKLIREIAEQFGVSAGRAGQVLMGRHQFDAVSDRTPPNMGNGKQRGAIIREQRKALQ